MRLLSLLIVLALCACSPRIRMLSSHRDSAGHRLHLFQDSLFVAYVGNNNEMFYRRNQISFGRFSTLNDSLISLLSTGLGKLKVEVRKDSLCKKGVCLRFVDRNGYALHMDHVVIGGFRDSAALWSDGYNTFYATRWAPQYHVKDSWGRFEMEPIILPDSNWHSYQVQVPLRFFELDDRMMLNDYRLRWKGANLLPTMMRQPSPEHDPMFSELVPAPISRAERRKLERRARSLKEHGHPDIMR